MGVICIREFGCQTRSPLRAFERAWIDGGDDDDHDHVGLYTSRLDFAVQPSAAADSHFDDPGRTGEQLSLLDDRRRRRKSTKSLRGVRAREQPIRAIVTLELRVVPPTYAWTSCARSVGALRGAVVGCTSFP